MTPPKARVAVLIATYGREQLLVELLESLAVMQTRYSYDVIVVDNERLGATASMVDRIANTFPFRIITAVEPRPGIAEARNRALALSSGYEIVCFIDDDEQVDIHWLDALIQPLEDDSVDMVSGPVESVFASAPPRWAILGGFFAPASRSAGDRMGEAATNNLAIRRRSLDGAHVQFFDERFSVTGGSDIFLTTRLSRSGMKIVWEPYAVVRETVPEQRCQGPWIVRRAVRGGGTHARVALLDPDRTNSAAGSLQRRMTIVAGGLARCAVGGLAILSSPVVSRQARGAKGLRVLLRGVGYLGVALNAVVKEYTRADVRT